MICGLGNALVDALVQIPDDSLLEELQLNRGTMHLVDSDRWEELFSRVEALGVEFHPGGSCANTIVTASVLGAHAGLNANVGDDRYGRIYADRMRESIGDHHVRQGPGELTGKCLSLISSQDAERTMVTDLGCAMDLPPQALFGDVIGGADIFHCTGYLFTGGPIGAVADEALRVAREKGTRVSFDVADPWVIDAFRERLRPVVEDHADVVFLNEAEAGLWGQQDDVLDAAGKLAETVPMVVLKLGRRGSVIFHEGQQFKVDAFRVEAVDTTGAGDAYAGGFLFGLDRGLDPARCGAVASRIAAGTVARVGSVVRDPQEARTLVAELL